MTRSLRRRYSIRPLGGPRECQASGDRGEGRGRLRGEHLGSLVQWVGSAINPYLGFLTGWLLAAGTLIGTLSPVVVLAPSVLAIFNQSTTNKVSNVAIATGMSVIMLIIAVIGIRLSARTQVAIGVIEYLILIVLAVWGCHGSLDITREPMP